MIGRVFSDRYEITERIGIGGMAEVYKAQDQVLRRVVAVKVMLPQYAADKEFTERFRLEAAAAAQLSSPYIVNIYDWGQDSGTYYIVMEYVRGIDLKSAIQQRGAINQRKVAEIGSQVCQALSVAHGQDIVHRDIKPQNIMVQPDGNVKVMDFGIARAKNSVKARTSNVLGTAHYISPEQAQGKELTGTSDIYSLGCVLYEAATGHLPFDGEEAVNVALKQVQEPPVPPSQVNPNIDADLEGIILKAMEKNPFNRFQTAQEMKRALDDYLRGRAVNLGAGAATTTIMGNNAQTQVMGANDYGYNNFAGGTEVMAPIEGTSKTAVRDFRVDDSAQKKNRSRRIAVGITTALLLAVIAAIAAWALFFNQDDGLAKVPELSDLTQAQAEAAIEKAGFELGEVEEVYDADTVAGHVCGQDPEAGTEAEKGTKINITLSLGVEKGQIPNLKGLSADEAQDAIEKAGFVAKFGGNENSDDVEQDKVCRQDPEPGTEADAGTTITYWISSGVESVSVPDVRGYPEREAIATLEGAGFVVESQAGDYSEAYDEGTVMSQSPNGGKLEKGETVTIYISQGVDPSTLSKDVPDVSGMSESAAISALNNYGFQNVSSEYRNSTEVPEGNVIGQNVYSATADSQIVIYVSIGPAASTPDDGGNNGNNGNNGDNGGNNGGNGDNGGNSETPNTDDQNTNPNENLSTDPNL
ncbi:Stk1 family PASTA domain-containing Ser/Thr kinase [Slackia heliotrinireducens]|uniref:Stk1 family PASTA domain-containing Ser/Thr kinase n=1 Tax=Slackia heliotrinireducens TaxID=84110 RepID=UPI0033162E97